MITADEKFEFIVDFITSYENKIKFKNSLGLFDTATMFENFAIKICELWFSKEFTSLNSVKFNFPYVDLISCDGETYIQVSTRDDAKTKIESTLKKISESSKDEIKKIKKVIFFMLHTGNIENVKDLVCDSQIGNIPFTKKDNLITTKDILIKAKNEPDFLNDLFNLIEKDYTETDNLLLESKKAIYFSKNVGLKKIDSLINNEYFINRDKLISEIGSSNFKNISIQGEAGSGKSVICKEIIKNEEILLYSRAERFLEETNLDNIWGFSFSKFLDSISSKKTIAIMIDSLEFIADSPTKIELLEQLYCLSEKYDNVKIITTCRSCDKNSFIKIEKNYNIKVYIIPELDNGELNEVSKRYDIVSQLIKNSSYHNLLKLPFYLNMLVSNLENIDNIKNETALREYIWEYVICLKTKIPANSNIKFSDIQQTVNNIVFERAHKFMLGVLEQNYDSEIIRLLLSEGVIIKNKKLIRLKYDIFEDICFEQEFDRLFYECKGNYFEFFSSINGLGRCVYRRYQIWVSNKLFIKETRNKFLYELVFSDNVPSNWCEQTKIGIIKSRYSSDFFEDYSNELVTSHKMKEFIDLINLYGFEFNNEKLDSELPVLQLKSCGAGREKIIEIIYNNDLYKTNDIKLYESIIKMCIDYSNQEIVSKSIAEIVCNILHFFIDEKLKQNFDSNYKLYDQIIKLLKPVYFFAEYDKEWITKFLNKLYLYFISENDKEVRFAEHLLTETFMLKHINLTKYLFKNICDLSYKVWTYKRPAKLNGYHMYYEDDSIYDKFGLNSFAKNYDSESYNNIFNNNFFANLFNLHFWDGMKWSINFVNELVLNYKKNTNNALDEIVITFVKKDDRKKFYGIEQWWALEISEYSIPRLIGDLIFVLINRIENIYNLLLTYKRDANKFLDEIKEYIYKNSNNTLFLYVLSQISIKYKEECKGLGIDLVTDIKLIFWDFHRYTYLQPNPTKELLEKSIMYSVGVPSLKKRYQLDGKVSLRDYFLETQLFDNGKLRQYCYDILDFLYGKYPDVEGNASENLQIQNMDYRKSIIQPYNDNTFMVTQSITGNAKKLISNSEKIIRENNSENSKIIDILNQIPSLKKIDDDSIELVNRIIDNYDSINNSLLNRQNLLMLITFIIGDKNTTKEMRNKCCIFWIGGIKKILNNECFAYEYNWSEILFSCYDADIDDYVKIELKKLMLECILHSGENGIMAVISGALKRYLIRNKNLSRVLFNTIIKLAEDKMNHQKYNIQNYNSINKREKITTIPIQLPFTYWIDRFFVEKKICLYVSKKENIINEYLINEANYTFDDFNIENYDTNLLCKSFITNVTYVNVDVQIIIKQLISRIIVLYKIEFEDYNFNLHKIVDYCSLHEFIEYIQEQLFIEESRENILNNLFDDIDFDSFTHDTEKFYLSIFDCILVQYFYAHNNEKQRKKCETLLGQLINKISSINNKTIKRNLSKIFVLADTSFSGHNGWEKLNSSYSYKDIQFLNRLFSKYGHLNFDDFIISLYRLNYKKLMPYILSSISDVMQLCNINYNDDFIRVINKRKDIILMIISNAFLDYSDEIKNDIKLAESFESILMLLIENRFEHAAVILSEFRTH